mgnify:CR=1 FL=1
MSCSIAEFVINIANELLQELPQNQRIIYQENCRCKVA